MIARLLLANGLEFLVGIGVVAVCDQPLGVAYLAGLAVVGIASAHLALIGITYGWLALSLSAVVSLLVAVARREGGIARLRGLCPAAHRVCGVWPASGVLAGVCARAWPTFAAKPLNDYDGWAEWGLKAKALTVLGWADPHLFAARLAIPNLNRDYPLLLPSLEAVAARAMGGFDSRLIHLQVSPPRQWLRIAVPSMCCSQRSRSWLASLAGADRARSRASRVNAAADGGR